MPTLTFEPSGYTGTLSEETASPGERLRITITAVPPTGTTIVVK